MTALISQRIVEALGELEDVVQTEGPRLSPTARTKLDDIKLVLVHLLHCLTGSSHDGEPN